MPPSHTRFLLLLLVFCWATGQAWPAGGRMGQGHHPDIAAAKALIQRIIPKRAEEFVAEPLPEVNGHDVFGLASKGGKIVLRGDDGVAIASALYYYLTEYCHCQVTWNGDNLRLPARLPSVPSLVRRLSPYRYRYYLNYCTFNYSMSWWDWERWQREIDWMALHGINMPLAITGEEYTWYQVYHDMGFSDSDLKNFFCGPAYFSWFWMGNLDGWGGPLPVHWREEQKDLQIKILARERELGMTPVLPAFTGHVPSALPAKFPAAHCKRTSWHNGFGDTYLLDPTDPLFAEIGRKFLAKQTTLFGTDHYYSADAFNENEPPSGDSAYLAGLSAKIFEGMRQVDTAAVWVMQGWLFYSDRKFWKNPQIKFLLDAVPDDHMLMLDLADEIEPVWKRTNAFYGKPWIWNMINNFGGNVNLYGRMDIVASAPALALKDSTSGKMQGIGLTMEGIATNPVLYELMLQHTWQSDPIDPAVWLRSYILNRYGRLTPGLEKAWDILRKTVYNGLVIRDGAETIVTGRPTLDSTTVWTRTKLNYAPGALLPAWDLMVKSTGSVAGEAAGREARGGGRYTDGFCFDLVDVSRQVLANYASVLQKKWVGAYRSGDIAEFDRSATDFLNLIDDLDTLLATRRGFLVGPWLADARRKGITPEEKALYEFNARDLITLWGDANSPLHEYANRQWSGLLKDFYRPRWAKFFEFLHQALTAGNTPDFAGFEKTIRQWEWAWVHEHKEFPLEAHGDPVGTARHYYLKYRKPMGIAWLGATDEASGQPTIDIRQYGAIGDGRTDNTRFIQQAIDHAASKGGGIIWVPRGRFVTGPLELRSHISLHLAFDHCTDIGVRGITLRNALDWVQECKSCSLLRIDSIHVTSNTFWNNDGIDLVDCKQVRLTNSIFNAGDDGICLKSEDPSDSCDDIYIAHCRIRSRRGLYACRTQGQ